MLRFAALCLCVIGVTPQPEVASPGPASGIVLREQLGLLITNCKTYTRKVYVRLDSVKFSELTTHSQPPKPIGPEPAGLEKSLPMPRQMLTTCCANYKKNSVTQAELSGYNRRPKRFLGPKRLLRL